MLDKKQKKCPKCKLIKSSSEYYIFKKKKFNKRDNSIKIYKHLDKYCKDCKKIIFKDISKNKRLIKKDGTANWKMIRRSLLKKAKKNNIIFNLTTAELKEWSKAQQNKCFYCEISIENSKKILKNFIRNEQNPFLKSPRFSIDRKSPEKGYVLNNICFACHVCNLHKGDFFSSDDFKKIANRYLKPKFKKMLI